MLLYYHYSIHHCTEYTVLLNILLSITEYIILAYDSLLYTLLE